MSTNESELTNNSDNDTDKLIQVLKSINELKAKRDREQNKVITINLIALLFVIGIATVSTVSMPFIVIPLLGPTLGLILLGVVMSVSTFAGYTAFHTFGTSAQNFLTNSYCTAINDMSAELLELETRKSALVEEYAGLEIIPIRCLLESFEKTKELLPEELQEKARHIPYQIKIANRLYSSNSSYSSFANEDEEDPDLIASVGFFSSQNSGSTPLCVGVEVNDSKGYNGGQI